MEARSRPSPGNRSSWLVLSGAILLLLGHGPARAAPPGPGSPGVAIQEHQAELSSTNEWCPVLTDERVDPEIYTEYLGGRVFFCCQKCLKQFRADPTAYTANLPTSVLPSEMASSSHQESTQNHHAGEESAHEHEHAPEGSAPTDQEHDHAAHGGSPAQGVRAWILWIGRLHPMWVHFPIALLLVAALAELLAARSGEARFAFAARFSLWAGTIGALVAAPLGWADALGVAEDYTGTPATLLFYHRWAGTSTAVVSVLALVLCERFYRGGQQLRPRLYRFVLLTAAVLVTVTGHLGASLIFGWDYLSK